MYLLWEYPFLSLAIYCAFFQVYPKWVQEINATLSSIFAKLYLQSSTFYPYSKCTSFSKISKRFLRIGWLINSGSFLIISPAASRVILISSGF